MKILVVSPDARRADQVRATLASVSQVASVAVAPRPLHVDPGPMAAGGVDLLVLDGTADAMAELEALERLPADRGRVPTVLLLDQQSPDVLLRAMRLGVREVVPPGALDTDLVPAIRRLGSVDAVPGGRRGQVLAFFGCKGGSGATFLATNLGHALSASGQARVLLIDLNLQFGDAHLMVSDRRPTMSLVDLAREIDRVDAALLKGSAIEVTPSYLVLPSPDDPAAAREVRPAHLDRLLALARQEFDFVLLDLGRSLDPITVRAIDQADFVLPVLQVTIPHVRETRRFLQVLRSLDCPPQKVRVIVNRAQKTGDVSMEDVIRVLGREPFATVPNHYAAVVASINQGVPVLRLVKSSPVARAIDALAKAFHEQPAVRGGWLRRVLGQ